MVKLPLSIKAFGSKEFNSVLKQELSKFKPTELPLHKATTQGGLVADTQFSISVLNSCETEKNIESKLAIFFDEMVGGCSCGDPPMQISNYCELQLFIEKETALVSFELL